MKRDTKRIGRTLWQNYRPSPNRNSKTKPKVQPRNSLKVKSRTKPLLSNTQTHAHWPRRTGPASNRSGRWPLTRIISPGSPIAHSRHWRSRESMPSSKNRFPPRLPALLYPNLHRQRYAWPDLFWTMTAIACGKKTQGKSSHVNRHRAPQRSHPAATHSIVPIPRRSWLALTERCHRCPGRTRKISVRPALTSRARFPRSLAGPGEDAFLNVTTPFCAAPPRWLRKKKWLKTGTAALGGHRRNQLMQRNEA